MTHKEESWLKKHADTMIILASFGAACIWMSGKFSELEKEMAVVKTVLIMRDLMPKELAKNEVKQ